MGDERGSWCGWDGSGGRRAADEQREEDSSQRAARATSADGEASASTIGTGASARRAEQRRTTRCRRIFSREL